MGIGGASRSIVDVIRAVDKIGCHVIVHTCSEVKAKQVIKKYCLKNTSVSIIPIRFKDHCLYANKISFAAKFLRQALFGKKDAVVKGLAIVNSHGSDWLLRYAQMNYEYDLKKIFIVRAAPDDNAFSKIGRNAQWAKGVINDYDKIVYLTQSVRDQWVKKGVRVNNFKIIHDVINEDEVNFLLESKSKPTNNPPVICQVGRGCNLKNQLLLLKACNSVLSRFDFKLHFIGDMEKQYKRILDSYLSDKEELRSRVKFYGHQNNALDFIYNSDIVVNPSKSEGFGRVTVEAMALGKKVIVSKNGCNEEIIDHKVNGLVFNLGLNEVQELSLCIKAMLDNETNTMGEFAREKWLNKYSRVAYDQSWMELINSMMI